MYLSDTVYIWLIFFFNSNTNDYASCTGLSTFEQDIVSVGEDGRINLLTAGQKQPVRSISTITIYSLCTMFILSIDFTCK